MMNKMRRRFVILATLAAFVVVAVVLAIVNLFAYQRTYLQINTFMDVLETNNGVLNYDKVDTTELEKREISLFDLSYFTVLYENGTVTVSRDRRDAISKEDAIAIANVILKEKKAKGTIENQKGDQCWYRVKNNGSTLVTVINVNSRIAQTRYTMILSASVGFSCIIFFCIVMIFLSKPIIRPAIRNMENQKQFITNAGHELKTPVAVISANMEVLEMLDGSNEWTQSSINQTKRLTELINELITLAKMGETTDIVLSNVNYTKIVQDAVASFDPVIVQNNKHLTSNIQEDVIVKAEEKNLAGLLDILLDNANKYCDEGGNIDVKLEKKGKNTIFTITNDYKDGQGQDYSRFFDRFYREDRSHNSSKFGFGIGLSMAASIVDTFKGKIKASYKNGRISFIVTI